MNSLFLLFLLMLGLPTLELYLLIQVGGEIGALPAVFLVVFTAVLGSLLVRQQGLSTLRRVRQALDRNEVPALQMLEGAVLLVGGLLLLIPGFLTDFLGFLCLVPGLRRLLIVRLIARGQIVAETRTASSRDARVIEGEFRREND
jgi:UPF0716 protein FxsA